MGKDPQRDRLNVPRHPDVDPARAANYTPQLGDAVRSIFSMQVAYHGELGFVYRVEEASGDQPTLYFIVFQNGGHDAFTLEECRKLVCPAPKANPQPVVDRSLSDTELSRAYHSGEFDELWADEPDPIELFMSKDSPSEDDPS